MAGFGAEPQKKLSFKILAKRVSLKIPSFEDYAHFYEARFNPDVTHWADDGHYELSLEDYAYGRMSAMEQGLMMERIIVLDGEPIGTVTGREYVEKTKQCTLGVVIAFQEHWGKGYGYEAIKQFQVLLAAEGIQRIVLDVYATNKRAQGCFHKLGFVKRRVYFAPHTGRFVVQMLKKLTPPKPIGECISRDDPRWRPPHQR